MEIKGKTALITGGAHRVGKAIALALPQAGANFVINNLENIGQHYALTLAHWRKRFQKNEKAIRALGFDEEFCRKWVFYFAYCEAGFASNHLGNLQLVLTRPRNPTLARLTRQQELLAAGTREAL